MPIIKTSREQKVWGSGKVSISVAYDFLNSLGSSTLADLSSTVAGTDFGGTGDFGGAGIFGDVSGGLKPALIRTAVRGTVLSTTLSNSTLDQSWSVHRFDHHLRESRVPSVKTATYA
jgi:hypothetical protein